VRTFRQTSDEILLAICEKFLFPGDAKPIKGSGRAPRRKGVAELAEELNKEWSKRNEEFHLSRQEIYPAMIEARQRGLLTLTPRSHQALQRRICDRFRQDPDHIRVVATESKQPDHVAVEAAHLMLSLIRQLAKSGKETVHIGFGAGWNPRVVAFQLATLLRSAGNVPHLVLHAASSGFAVDQPHTAPVTYFGFFEQTAAPSIDQVGIFGPPFVPRKDYPATLEQAGVREAFARRDEIDVMVTSLASAKDEDGDLRRSMKEDGALEQKADLPKLEREGWVGDVQHLPYSATEPIEGDLGYRAVTLFDLKDLAELAGKPDKHVVLVSSPCSVCHRTRADALLPLLSAPQLKVWTHLVTDIPTARDVMELAS